MHGPHGRVDVLRPRHDRDPDLRRADHLDVDARRGERREEPRGHPGVRAHPRADQRDLADLVVVLQRVEADVALAPG